MPDHTMHHSAPAICWPAILKYAGQATLSYLENESDWLGEAARAGRRFSPQDRLIDTAGRSYRLPDDGSAPWPEPCKSVIALDEVVEWVRAHLAQQAECCVAKFSASSCREAIEIVRRSEE